MAQRTDAELKALFEAGDQPTQGNFADLIDSKVNQADFEQATISSTEINITATAYGGVGNGVTDNFPALTLANNALVAVGGGTIYFPFGTYRVADNFEFSNLVQLRFEKGAKLSPVIASTVSNVDLIGAPNAQIFTGSGSVTLRTGAVYNVIHYGATGDGSTNDYAAIKRVVDALGIETFPDTDVLFPPGTYLINTSITFVPTTRIVLQNAQLAPGTGTTTTINGSLLATDTQIFTGLGTIVLTSKVKHVLPQWWGAVGNGIADDYAAINKARAALVTMGGGDLLFLHGTYVIGTSISFAASIRPVLEQGALLSPNTGRTVTLNSQPLLPFAQVFTGAGTIILAVPFAVVYAQWWGAKADGVTSDTSAINKTVAAVTALASGGAVIYTPGTYVLDDNVTVPADVQSTFIQGAVFNIAATKTLALNGVVEAPDGSVITSGSGVVSYGQSSQLQFYRKFTQDVLNSPSTVRHNNPLYIEVEARHGGTYNEFGAFPSSGYNAAYSWGRVIGVAHTPGELVGWYYNNSNFSAGDSGLAAGTTSVYGGGLGRGIEHNTNLGTLQSSAVLTSGSTSATVLGYDTELNESAFGEGRDLIDTSVNYATGTVTLTQGISTVTGSGTTFTSGMVGQYFRVTQDDRTLGGVVASAWYKIALFTDTTHIGLEIPYGGDSGAALAYGISPGAMVLSYDTVVKTITVAANSVAWAVGNVVHFRISIKAQITGFVSIMNRTLPNLYNQDANFVAAQNSAVGTEKIYAALKSAYGKWRSLIYLATNSTIDAIIDAHDAIYTTACAFLLPAAKRIIWGGTTPTDLSSPAITATTGNSGELQYRYGDKVVFRAQNVVNRITTSLRKTSIADNVATGIFTVATTDESGSNDGGAYSVIIRALISHAATAGNGNTSAKYWSATWTRIMLGTGTGSNNAVENVFSGTSIASSAGVKDIGTITGTIVENSEYENEFQLQIDLTGSAVATAEVTVWVELIHTGFTTAPVIAGV